VRDKLINDAKVLTCRCKDETERDAHSTIHQLDQTTVNLLMTIRSEVQGMHKRMQQRGQDMVQGYVRAKAEGENWAEKREAFNTWASTYSVSTEEIGSFLRFEA
jgi:hypothetical protein